MVRTEISPPPAPSFPRNARAAGSPTVEVTGSSEWNSPFMLKTFRFAFASQGRPSTTEPFTVSSSSGRRRAIRCSSKRKSPFVVFALKRPALFRTSTLPLTDRKSPPPSTPRTSTLPLTVPMLPSRHAIRNVNVILDGYFDTLTFWVSRVDGNLARRAIDVNLDAIQILDVSVGGFHCFHFHFVAIPAFYLHGAIHVFEQKTSARRQWIAVFEGLAIRILHRSQAPQKRQAPDKQ